MALVEGFSEVLLKETSQAPLSLALGQVQPWSQPWPRLTQPQPLPQLTQAQAQPQSRPWLTLAQPLGVLLLLLLLVPSRQLLHLQG